MKKNKNKKTNKKNSLLLYLQFLVSSTLEIKFNILISSLKTFQTEIKVPNFVFLFF